MPAMRTRRTVLHLLLAASLLLGQWLAAGHDGEHGLQSGAGDACAVCVYAHGAGTGALPALPQLVIQSGPVAPPALSVAGPRVVAVRHHPIRGPPALLA